jgi:hypothetical protein
MSKHILATLVVSVFTATLGLSAVLRAQAGSGAAGTGTTTPDFSGVYFPTLDGGGARPAGGPGPAGLPIDGSKGREPTAPRLTPEYFAKWEKVSKTRVAGSYEFDLQIHCLPPGMPAMMGMPYGFEILQTKDKISILSELNDAYRRIYLDGRKPSQKVLGDATYAGYSTGRWEGDTLVVDTIALNPISYVEGFTPHSDAMTVKERIRFVGPGLLEDAITVTDPKAFTAPWSVVRHYKKAAPPNDEIREFACSELFLSTPIPK